MLPKVSLAVTFVLALCTFGVAQQAAAQTTSPDEDLVIQFYPSDLGPFGEKLYDFARADLERSGRADYIVAVYCGNPRGVVRVLRAPAGSPATLAAEIAPDTMGGHFPTLRLVDLDGDGRPEISASFATIRAGAETWLFRWTSGALEIFGPTTVTGRRAIRHAVLGVVDYFDVDGDGIAEIVETDREAQERRIWKRNADGHFGIVDNRVLYANRFERHTATPELYTAMFESTPGKKLVITVVNGDGIDEHAVTSGDLFFNGQPVFRPADFKKNARVLTATVTAAEENEIESMLEGKPGSAITVAIAEAK
jgi:hypothetical protein